MGLEGLIHAEIAASGPMRLDRYMTLCLSHPVHGYYTRGAAFGRHGDFTTAPEISQIFGELIGLWAAQVWLDLGRPAALRLVELGPGRGTLMTDALRAAAAAAGWRPEVWLIETSPALRAAQARAIPQARSSTALQDAPQAPMVLIANEFFDALPIRQFVRRGGVWRERLVGATEGRLVWGLGPPRPDGPDAPDGAVREVCPTARAIAGQIGARLAADGGAALIVDYGALPPAVGGGDTLQAVRGHAPADPLVGPGAADLTAHVDFAALAAALRAGGARVAGPLDQGTLLGALGVAARAAALARARPARAAEIAAAAARLTDPAAMGTLFKALAAAGAGQPRLPAFEELDGDG